MRNQFMAEFQEERDYISSSPDFSDKQRELEKFKQQELAKFERQLKKDINEWEELFAGNVSLSKSAKGLQQLGDKISKFMDSQVKKTLKKGILSEEHRLVYETNCTTAMNSENANVKRSKLLDAMCGTYFKKNFELYYKHELMLAQNKKERLDLAADFQKQMSDIQAEIN